MGAHQYPVKIQERLVYATDAGFYTTMTVYNGNLIMLGLV
jgi:hypothetical protein